MKLIVGLGNPGEAYQDSRHNIGFLAVEALAKTYRARFVKNNLTRSLCARVKIRGCSAILAMPHTFMNLSGNATRALVKKYKIDLADLLVVYDDLDLELGRIKIRPSGSSGGHRGLESIIESLKSQDFTRLRIGIGRQAIGTDTAGYVLSGFKDNEKKQLKDILREVVLCCELWVSEGTLKSMNIFNRKAKKQKS
ncbi:MAG: aminoacyl-tRNA hydrolase [Omnitrophica WOR_2 bacterium RBG_13_41_10]|nr:MAG: aminoacyl-tRNA hydrolase [Omnitrophica WOR_2 bacterium RBG_13_41_10]